MGELLTSSQLCLSLLPKYQLQSSTWERTRNVRNMSPPSAATESIIYPACYAQKKFTWGMKTSISSGSKKLTCFPAVSAGKEEDVHTGGHGGESGNDGGNGGGNKGGDNDNSGESKHDMGHGEDKAPMSISQKLTLGYAVLVGAGGLIGYLKSGSHMSLIAGSLSASLLYYVYTLLPTKPSLPQPLALDCPLPC